MSLSSTPTLKAWLTNHLGPILSPKYFDALSDFFNARVSRDEFSDAIHNVFQESLAQQYRMQQEQPTQRQTSTLPSSQSAEQPSLSSQSQLTPQPVQTLPQGPASDLTPGSTQSTLPPSQSSAPQQIQQQTSQSGAPSASTSQSQPTAQSAAAASAASDRLIQVHNALIISLFDATTHHRRSGLLGAFQHSHAQNQAALAARGSGGDGSDLDGAGGGAGQQRRRRKRRRLGYGYDYAHGDGDHPQEEGFEDDGMWSDRLRRWVIGMGKGERERIKSLAMLNSAAATGTDDEGGGGGGVDPATVAPSLPETDEINMERAVVYLPERGEPPGVRRPVSLAVLTRAPTVQHIADRVNLISAQHDLAGPSKDVASLLLLALEAKIKQLVTHALTLTQSGLSIQSIPATSGAASSSGRYTASGAAARSGGGGGGVMSIDALDTLFTVSPSDLPQGSAAVMTRLSLGDDRGDDVDGADLLLIRDREVNDQRWQVMALLAERSAVRESLQTRPRV